MIELMICKKFSLFFRVFLIISLNFTHNGFFFKTNNNTEFDWKKIQKRSCVFSMVISQLRGNLNNPCDRISNPIGTAAKPSIGIIRIHSKNEIRRHMVLGVGWCVRGMDCGVVV